VTLTSHTENIRNDRPDFRRIFSLTDWFVKTKSASSNKLLVPQQNINMETQVALTRHTENIRNDWSDFRRIFSLISSWFVKTKSASSNKLLVPLQNINHETEVTLTRHTENIRNDRSGVIEGWESKFAAQILYWLRFLKSQICKKNSKRGPLRIIPSKYIL
jgi:hypothetical protein